MPLRLWFRAIFEVVRSKRGLSAKELQRILNFGSYQTAWAWLHKIRECMAVADTVQLGPEVEIDEAEIGPRLSRMRGSKSSNKVLVVAAVEQRGRGSGKVRFRVIEDRSAASLHGFIESWVTDASVVTTDNYPSYDGAPQIAVHRVRTTSTGTGYQRSARSGKHVGDLHLPRINNVFSLVKRRLLGTYQGGVRKQHMQKYLNEFAFQFSRRILGDPCLAIPDLMRSSVQTRPKGYRAIVDDARGVPRLTVRAVPTERQRPAASSWWVRLRDRLWEEG